MSRREYDHRVLEAWLRDEGLRRGGVCARAQEGSDEAELASEAKGSGEPELAPEAKESGETEPALEPL